MEALSSYFSCYIIILHVKCAGFLGPVGVGGGRDVLISEVEMETARDNGTVEGKARREQGTEVTGLSMIPTVDPKNEHAV
jgi:hypothetical protein